MLCITRSVEDLAVKGVQGDEVTEEEEITILVVV